jgi:hypothetical protein
MIRQSPIKLNSTCTQRKMLREGGIGAKNKTKMVELLKMGLRRKQ